MLRWEKKFVYATKWKRVLDAFRWILILVVWGFVFYKLLTAVSPLWAIVWLLPGFVLVMNVVGFLTLPLYALVAWKVGPKLKDVFEDPGDKVEQ